MRPIFYEGKWTPYRPWSDERREKARIAQALSRYKRLGIPVGHVQLYGVIVPSHIAEKLRPWAVELARRQGYRNAHAFVKKEASRTKGF